MIAVNVRVPSFANCFYVHVYAKYVFTTMLHNLARLQIWIRSNVLLKLRSYDLVLIIFRRFITVLSWCLFIGAVCFYIQCNR